MLLSTAARGRILAEGGPLRHYRSDRHDIVVKQHAGSIEVNTELGEFAEIKIILPRAAAVTTGGGS